MELPKFACIREKLRTGNKPRYLHVEAQMPNTQAKPDAAPTQQRWCSTKYNRYHVLAVIATCLASLLCIIAIQPWMIPSRGLLPTANGQRELIRSCGNTSEEAMRAGCRFDVMSFTWSVPDCFDEELMEDFLSLDWTWWLDDSHTKLANFDDVAAGMHAALYVSWKYHKFHCAYMWKKMHRAILSGRPLDSYIGSVEHTQHCGGILLDHDVDWKRGPTEIYVKFPTCAVPRVK